VNNAADGGHYGRHARTDATRASGDAIREGGDATGAKSATTATTTTSTTTTSSTQGSAPGVYESQTTNLLQLHRPTASR
jgi:hypothetical protein